MTKLDKKDVNLFEKQPKVFTIGKDMVEIMPYISPVTEALLIQSYVDSYFMDNSIIDNFLQAEWGLVLRVIDYMTSVKIVEDENSASLESLITSGLWKSVRGEIENYEEFRNNLDKVVRDIKEQKALEISVGSVLNNVSNKIIQFVEKIQEVDLSQEGIQKLVSDLKLEANKFDNTFGTTPTPKKPKKKFVEKDIVQ
jgi:hypothetical protein